MLKHVLLVVALDEFVVFICLVCGDSLRRVVVEVVILLIYFTV